MPVNKQSADHGLIVAALLAAVTNWDETETRIGRRGQYHTTGASMYRIRQLTPEEADSVKVIVGTLGVDLDDEDITEIFDGEHEFQVSYACNRFEVRGGVGSQRLTQNEMRTLERAKLILVNKEAEATRILTTPDSKAA